MKNRFENDFSYLSKTKKQNKVIAVDNKRISHNNRASVIAQLMYQQDQEISNCASTKFF